MDSWHFLSQKASGSLSRLLAVVCVVWMAGFESRSRLYLRRMRLLQILTPGARFRKLLTFVLLALVCAGAQVPSPWVDTKPLAIDIGVTGLKLTLRRLHTTARLMHTTAHPDDEDGGMLTLRVARPRRHRLAVDPQSRRGWAEQSRQRSARRTGNSSHAGVAGGRPLLRRRAALHPRRRFRILQDSRRDL